MVRGIWEAAPFAGFGPSGWTVARQILATEIVLPRDDAAARRLIRARCPLAPGVYGMIDPRGELIYVGKSRSLRDRLVSYFYDADSNEKGRRIIAHSERLVWEPAGHEFAALARELELIRRWRPRFNVQGQPGRVKRAYVCLSDGPAPRLQLLSQPTRRARRCFGPIPGNRRARDGVRRLNHLFELRDCPADTPLHFSDQRELFPRAIAPLCLRHDLGSCPAPCAAGCSTGDYDRRVADVLAFLRGTNVAPLARLEAEMDAAAAARRFELAALLRDEWTELAWMNEQLEQARDAQTRYSFVYPLPGHGRRRDWYFIRHGQLVGALAAPRDRHSARRCLARLKAIYRDGSEQPPEDTDLLWLVCRWFRGREEELATTLSPEDAIAHCKRLLARKAK